MKLAVPHFTLAACFPESSMIGMGSGVILRQRPQGGELLNLGSTCSFVASNMSERIVTMCQYPPINNFHPYRCSVRFPSRNLSILLMQARKVNIRVVYIPHPKTYSTQKWKYLILVYRMRKMIDVTILELLIINPECYNNN